MSTKTEPLQPELNGGTETILLVDDEEYLRLAITQFLSEMLGYKTFCAGSAEEALSMAQSYPGNIDLLLADVLLPGMSGSELAEKLLSSRPTLRVIYMSGYTDHNLAEYGISSSNSILLQKPFTLKVLAAKLREVLDHKHEN